MKHVIAFFVLLTTASFASSGGPDESEPMLWLPIAATKKEVSEALTSLSNLQQRAGELLLVETDDCQDLPKGLYVVVAGIHESRSAAESKLEEWHRLGVKDAYLRECQAVVPSRLSLGIPLLDPSFRNPAIEPVNWELEDVVTRVIPLSDQTTALVLPIHEADPEDVREGLRISVRIHLADQHRNLDLSSDCIDPAFSLGTEHIALTCVNESAAAHLLHRTQLFSLPGGQLIAEESRCTNPVFTEERWTCEKESVNANGIMELQRNVLYPR